MDSTTLEPLQVPLWQDETGTIRIGNSRVLLELVVRMFRNGATPEEIVQAYDTLELPDVYAVLAWYLAHEAEALKYMQKCDTDADSLRRKIESTQPERTNLRETLLARQRVKDQERAASSE